MNPVAILNTQFVQIALPLMVTFIAAGWFNGKRIDDINRRLDEIIKRLDRIEALLSDHDSRIARLEERTSPVRR